MLHRHLYIGASGLIFTAVIDLFTGPMAFAAEAANEAANIETPSQSTQSSDDQNSNHTARGVLTAGQSADIAAGMSGRLLKAPHKKGQYVKSGTLLAQFDCARLNAELESRKTAHATQSLRYDNQNELLALGAAGELNVSIARSERDEMQAQIRMIDVTMRDCKITAPFSGYITERHVNAFETPQVGQPIYSLIRAGSTELSVIVPSSWVKWLKAGQVFSFKVDETGETVQAKLLRLSAEVDPVSQTIEITAKPVGKAKARPGMSGLASFTKPE